MTDIQFIYFKSLCKAVGSASKRMQKPYEKTTKCSLKTTDVLLETDGHVLT